MEQKIEVDKLIFDFVYELALRDAVMRTAYLGDKSELRKNEYAKNIVRDYADDIINKKSFDYYDIAKKLCDEFNSEKNSDHQFTFGNAQKLLNMTIKYLYIMCYKNNELRENFKNCHCPMDRIMIDKVINELKNLKKNGDDQVQGYTERGYIGSLKSKSWSRLSFEDINIYQQFQDSVKFLANKKHLYHSEENHLYPLEYDYYLWNKKEETTAD